FPQPRIAAETAQHRVRRHVSRRDVDEDHVGRVAAPAAKHAAAEEEVDAFALCQYDPRLACFHACAPKPGPRQSRKYTAAPSLTLLKSSEGVVRADYASARHRLHQPYAGAATARRLRIGGERCALEHGRLREAASQIDRRLPIAFELSAVHVQA